MKPIEYFLTEKGKKIEDPKYSEEEKEILKSLESGRKNISQIRLLLLEKNPTIAWETIRDKLELLEKEKLVEKFK
ncbi:MAG: hypothetical protein KKF48_02630 [Nanoarchaeota archaeon]|nr:hypothetical protein [Nanoarchaeota archaeon]MBU1027917.1 hypothetical protein [Nanoarchaeota archaeon]